MDNFGMVNKPFGNKADSNQPNLTQNTDEATEGSVQSLSSRISSARSEISPQKTQSKNSMWESSMDFTREAPEEIIGSYKPEVIGEVIPGAVYPAHGQGGSQPYESPYPPGQDPYLQEQEKAEPWF